MNAEVTIETAGKTAGEHVRVAVDRVRTAQARRWKRRAWAMGGLGAALIAAVIVTAAIGSTHIGVPTVYKVLVHRVPFVNVTQDWAPTVETIVMDIRMPRIILAALVGASLGMAGATYQGLFRNPLADPYLIGVAQGGALGAVVGFVLPAGILAGAGGWSLGVVPMAAFAGALMAAGGVYMLARVGRSLPVTTLVLAGVALGSFLGSITFFIVLSSSNLAASMMSWIIGGFSISDWGEVKVLLPYAVAGAAVICLYSRSLNVMQLDDEQAQQLGVNVERTKLVLLGAATLVTAAAVSFAGPIGFVGIIVPHAVRLIWGPDHRALLPLSAVAGALFLVLADALVRGLGSISPTFGEVPVGVITALVGAPFFLVLLRRKKRSVF